MSAVITAVVGSAVIGGIGASKSNKAPKKVPYNAIDPYAEADRSMTWNAAQADTAEALIGRANRFSQDEALSLMERAMPGYSQLSQSLMSTAQNKVDNPYEVPKDVEQNLIRLANERGVNLGTRGQFNEFSLLRDFGVNSLQYGQSNIQQASQILGMLSGTAPRINPLSPTSLWMDTKFAVNVAADQAAAVHGVDQGHENARTAASNARWAAYTDAAQGAFGGIMGKFGG